MKLTRYTNLQYKYFKFKKRLDQAIKNGSFARYTYRKRQMLIKRLHRLQKQLEQLGIQWKHAAVGTLAISALSLSTSQAQAQSGSDEFRVNTYTTDTQEYTSVARDADGDFVVVWDSYGQDGHIHSVRAQRYNDAGEPQGDEFLVGTSSNGSSGAFLYPDVAMDDEGSFVVTWRNYTDGSQSGVSAQRYSHLGIPLGGEINVNTYTTNHQDSPSIAMSATGEFIITWESSGQDGSESGIYAQLFNSDGSPNGGEFRVNTETSESQIEPVAAMDDEGNFVVVWTSYADIDDIAGLYGQLFNNTGEALGGEFLVDSYDSRIGFEPSVAKTTNGDFVIAWEEYSLGNISAQRYNSAGVKQGAEILVNTHTTNTQSSPSLAVASDGGFVITWESNQQDGDGYGIYAQRFSNIGAPIGEELLVNATSTTESQRYPDVATDSEGDFVITWHSGISFYQANAFARRFELDGAPVLTLENQSVNEGDELSFIALATNDEGQVLSYTLDDSSIASGMTINESTGVFSWIPEETQDGDHQVIVMVSDGVFNVSEEITITVNEVNTAPLLTEIGNRAVEIGVALTFNVTATDSDDPAQTLSFGLDSESESAGMTINASTGAFSWIPTAAQVGSHTVTVSVTDGTLSDSQEVQIVVEAPLSTSAVSAGIRISPNPSKSVLSIVAADAVVAKSYRILNVQGQEVRSAKLADHKTINIEALNAGIYFLKLYGDQLIQTIRFIKED